MPSDPPIETLAAALKRQLKGRVCIVGIGNALKGDDGAGPEVIRKLEEHIAADCLDAGVAPENHAEQIVRKQPDVVLLVDAMDFRGAPGEFLLLDGAAVEGGGISSHALPLRILCEYLRARLPCRLLLLGIQPASSALGQPLSDPVSRAVRHLADLLTSLLLHR